MQCFVTKFLVPHANTCMLVMANGTSSVRPFDRKDGEVPRQVWLERLDKSVVLIEEIEAKWQVG
jgi:hypothetical protein